MLPVHLGLHGGLWTSSAALLLLIRLSLIGGLAHLALIGLRRGPAALRHLIATTALAAMVVVTAVFALGPAWPVWSVPLDALPAALRPAGSTVAVTPRPAIVPIEVEVPAATASASTPGAGKGERFLTHPVSVSAPAPGPERRDATPELAAPFPLEPGPLALALALAVAAALALGHAVAALWVAWRTAAARPVTEPDLLARLHRVRAALGCGRLRLKTSRRARVPFVTGIARPVLVLPESALAWDQARVRAVLLHEVAHVARRDVVALWIARLATTAAWFHPLAWTLARAAHRECERACDDVVIGAGVRPSFYAEELLAIARAAGRSPAWIAAPLAVAHAGQLEGRLLAILSPDVRRGPASPRAVAIAVAAALAVVAPLTSVRVVAANATACEGTLPGITVVFPALTSEPPEPPRPGEPPAPGEDVATVVPFPGDNGRHFYDPDSPDVAAFRFASGGSRSGADWYGAAVERYESGRYGEAALFFERAARAGYRAATAWYNAACSFSLDHQVNRGLGALQSAIDEGFDQVAKIQSDSDLNDLRADGRLRMMVSSLLHSDAGDRARRTTVARYRDLIRERSPEPGELRGVGVELLRADEPRLAAEAFARQYALDSTSSALYNQACAQAVGQQPAEALATLERAIQCGYSSSRMSDDPDLVSLHGRPDFSRLVRLADDLRLDLGDWGEEASRWRSRLAHVRQVTRDHPDLGRAWFNRGFVELRAGEVTESRNSFLRALDLGYQRPTTL